MRARRDPAQSRSTWRIADANASADSARVHRHGDRPTARDEDRRARRQPDGLAPPGARRKANREETLPARYGEFLLDLPLLANPPDHARARRVERHRETPRWTL